MLDRTIQVYKADTETLLSGLCQLPANFHANSTRGIPVFVLIGSLKGELKCCWNKNLFKMPNPCVDLQVNKL